MSPSNTTPVLTFSEGTSLRTSTGAVVSFSVMVADPDTSQPLRVRLLSVHDGCVFVPIFDQFGSATSGLTWQLSPFAASGPQRLEFEATDGVATIRSIVTVDVAFVPPTQPYPSTQGFSRAITGDVTGDGLPDIVTSARFANVGGIADTGAVYVWKSNAMGGAPTALLRVPGAVAQDRLSESSGQGVQLADVTGDGILDVVATASLADVGGITNAGAVYVWRGGTSLTGTVDPLATLRVAGASNNRLGEATGQGVLLTDLTGDGVVDVAVVSRAGGSVVVWRGGPTLTGLPDPLATLQASGSSGAVATGQAVLLADVTGDGLNDVVLAAASADVGPVSNAGVIHVWRGDAGLAGPTAPTATLTVPGAVSNDQLCRVTGGNPGPGLLLSDVSGDGILDIVGVASLADVAGVLDSGAVYVWIGGATLTGAVAPTATLRVPGAATNDQLGNASGFGVQFADVTGDLTLDLVVGAQLADGGGVVDSGAVYVWSGGAGLSGTLDPSATLQRTNPVAGDKLGFILEGGSAIQLSDVSGDGVADVVVGASSADVSGVVDAGVVSVWNGGPLLAGTIQPSASLEVPGAAAGDRLSAASGVGIGLAEVTGDGTLDVIVAASSADEGGVTDVGALYVWSGGAGLSGTLAPTARLRIPGAVAGDGLGLVSSGQGFQVVDLTSDGLAEIITAAQGADVGGVVDAGAIYVWQSGATLVGTPGPIAILRVPGAVAGDQLGRAASWRQLADVTGDGLLDVIGFTRLSDVGGVMDTGEAYVWRGGSSLNGTVDPRMNLRVADAKSVDFLGSSPVPLLDYTGDGVLDVVTGSSSATLTGLSAVGAVYVWPGNATALGPVDAFVLSNPSAVAFDALGE